MSSFRSLVHPPFGRAGVGICVFQGGSSIRQALPSLGGAGGGKEFPLAMYHHIVASQMAVGQGRGHASAWRALDESLHDEEGFVDLFHRSGVFADGRGDGADAHRTASELVDDGQQNLVVDFVEAVLVDVEGLEGQLGDGSGDGAVALHLCEVAHTSQQRVGDAGRAAAPSSYLVGRVVLYGHPQQRGRAAYDALQRRGVVVFQVHVDTEAGPQRSGEHAAAGGGSHEREGVEVYLYGACRRPLVDHDVDAVVLHGRVEVFLHHGGEAVYLVDEEHVVGFQRRQNARQVARFVEDGPAGDLESHAQFVGDDVAQRRLAQSRRPVEQGVVERFAAILGRFHEHLQVFHHLGLAVEVGEAQGSQRVLEVFFGGREPFFPYIKFV